MKRNYIPHIFAISYLFTLGNSIILMTSEQMPNIFVCCAITIVMLFVVLGLLHLSKEKKTLYFIVISLVGVVALYGAITTFLNYFKFLKTEQLPHTNAFLLTVVLISITVFFVTKKEYAIYKYCLFSFLIIALIILICLVSGIKNFDYKNFKFTFSSLTSLQNALCFLPIIVLPIFNQKEPQQIKPTALGITVGFASILLMLAQTALTLGTTDSITTPYLKTVSAISLGSLFTRLDGLVWFMFFVCAMVKVCVCVKVFLKSINIILEK